MLPFSRILQYGNAAGTAPVFLMKDFISSGDIKDKSLNAIPITVNGNIPVGSDQYGTYMNFTGQTTQWIEFKNTKLDIGEAEIIVVAGNFQYRSTMYANPIIDCRPYQTNGAYFFTSYTSNKAAPFAIQTVYGGTNYIDSPDIQPELYPVTLKFRVTTSGTTVYYNDTLVSSSPLTCNFVGQYFKIGRNAFIATAQVPYLYAKIYRIEIRKI